MSRRMNRYIVCLTVFLSSVLNAQEDALAYYTVVRAVFSDIQDKSWDYTCSAAHGKSTARVEEKRKKVSESIENGIVTLFSLPPIDGSSALRDSALRFLKMQYAVSNEDFSRVVNMENIAEQSHDAMEAYMNARNLADATAKNAGDMFNREFIKFMTAHNIPPAPETESEKKLTIASGVYEYYNQLYQIFFSSYKQESYLIDAMKKDDVSGIEQNRDALARTSEEALSAIMFFGSYQEDRDLKNALEKVLAFYKDEAENKLKDISLFFVANDNFQKILLSYNNSPAAEHSVEESVLFNKALSENKATNEHFIKICGQLDKERSKVLSDWHKECERFIRRHVPKS